MSSADVLLHTSRMACKCVTAQRFAHTQRSQPSGRRGSDDVSLTVCACMIKLPYCSSHGVAVCLRFGVPGWVSGVSEQPRRAPSRRRPRWQRKQQRQSHHCQAQSCLWRRVLQQHETPQVQRWFLWRGVPSALLRRALLPAPRSLCPVQRLPAQVPASSCGSLSPGCCRSCRRR